MLLESSKTHTSARAPGAALVPYTDQSRQCSVSLRCVSVLNEHAALEFVSVPGPVLSPVCAGQRAPVLKQFSGIPGGLFLLCSNTDWKREPAKAIISYRDGTEMRTLVLLLHCAVGGGLSGVQVLTACSSPFLFEEVTQDPSMGTAVDDNSRLLRDNTHLSLLLGDL